MRTRLSLLSPRLAVPLLAAAALAAQNPDTSTSPPADGAAITLRGLSTVERRGDEIWGRGENYRIGLSDRGAEFTPYLGSDAPRAYPLRLSLAEVRREAGESWRPHQPTAPALDGDMATYHHDAERLGRIEERYQVGPEGTELSILLPRPVAGSGPLTVSMNVETDLEAPASPRLDTLTLHGDAHAEVSIGSVTGIDAAGRRCSGWLSYRSGVLDMVLPEGFVEAATWPILVDPLIGSRRSTSNFAEDVVAIPDLDQYMIVFTSFASGSDGDISAIRVDASSGNQVALDQIAVGPDWQQAPAAASYFDGTRTIVRVAYKYWLAPAPIQGNDVFTSDWDSLSQSAGMGQQVLPNVIGEWGEPDIGVANGQFAVVAADVPQGGNGISLAGDLGSAIIPIPNLRGDYPRNVTISKSGGQAARFVVCWDQNRTGTRDVYFRTVDRFGSLGSELSTGLPRGASDAEVDSDGDTALMVVATPEASTVKSDVFGAHIPLTATNPRPTFFPIEDESNDDEVRPAVTYFGNDMYGVLWVEEIGSTGNRQIQGVNVLRGDNGRCGREWNSGGGGGSSVRFTAAASAFGAGGQPDQGAMVWNGSQGSFLLLFEGYGPGGSVRDLGGACGLGGTLTAHGGPFAFGNRDFRLELTGANNGTPTAATMLVKLGNNPGFFRCGSGCALLLQDFDVGFGVSGNVTTFPLPVTCNPNFFDRTVVLQALVLTPAVNPCGLAPASVSNSMSVTIRD